MRLRKSYPVFRVLNYSFYDLPCPINLTIMWSFGSLISLFYLVQVVSGFFLSCHYVASAEYAFSSVMHIQRDVVNGWALRNIHSNSASMMMGCIYIHIARGLFYSSYVRLSGVWVVGVVLLVMSMAAAFLGYVLPWGQMSYWGATVITSLFSVIPLAGSYIVEQILWGGYTVGSPTLTRFYSLHFLTPLAMAPVIMAHLVLLHKKGSSNPLGADSSLDCVPFHPYYSLSDLMAAWVGIGVLGVLAFGYPHLLSCHENFEPADPLKTPIHIQPEWYFLPFYAILRSIPHKGAGVVTMFFSIFILFFLPWTHRSYLSGLANYKIREFFLWVFFFNWLALGWVGSCALDYPFLTLGGVHTGLFFFYFLFDYFLICFLDPFSYKESWKKATNQGLKVFNKYSKVLMSSEKYYLVGIWDHTADFSFVEDMARYMEARLNLGVFSSRNLVLKESVFSVKSFFMFGCFIPGQGFSYTVKYFL